jgi:hypothetical protein
MMMLLSFSSCFSQYWERFLGGPDTYEYIYNIDESYDNGYILGTLFIDEITPTYEEWTRSSFIYKTNINGDTLWYRNFRHDPIVLYSCRDVGDGTTVALLDSWDYVNDCFNIFLVRLDACGNKIWCKEIFDNSGYGFGALDMEFIDNKIVFCREHVNPNLGYKYDILMYDLNGQMVCEKPFLFYNEYPLMNSPFLFRMLPLPDNEFMMLGRAYYKENQRSVGWLRSMFIKFDTDGNEQWVLPFGVSDTIVSTSTNCENVVWIEDREVYYAFSCDYTESDSLQLLLMKFDDNGIEKGYELSRMDSILEDGFSPYFSSATLSEDPNKIITTVSYRLPDDPNHIGNIYTIVDSTISEFHDTLNLSGFQVLFSKITRVIDGEIITGGFDLPYDEVQAYMNKISLNPLSFDTMNNAPYTYDSLCTENIVYADTIYFDDCLNVGDKEFANDYKADHPLHLYPNPATEELSISFGAKAYSTPITITIHTFTGEIKWQGTLALGEQTKRLSVYSWPKGIYIVTARKGNEVVGREKVVVM